MLRRPSNDDPGAWIYYWRRVGQGWRREPEIGIERQGFLCGLINNTGITSTGERFPFDRIILHRGDIEWIVAEYPGQRLDLRGADHRWHDLSGIESAALALLILDGAFRSEAHNDLTIKTPYPIHQESEGLPSNEQIRVLEKTGIHENEGNQSDPSVPLEGDPKARRLLDAYGAGERDFTGWDLVGALLKHACLKDANLTKANLENADLSNADLSNAILIETNLCAANISFANLTSTNLFGAKLVGAELCSAVMRNSNLTGADFDWANLANAQLQGSHWGGAHWGRAKWPGAVWNDPPAPRPSSYEPARPVSSEDYIGEWWSRDRDS